MAVTHTLQKVTKIKGPWYINNKTEFIYYAAVGKKSRKKEGNHFVTIKSSDSAARQWRRYFWSNTII